MKALETFPRLLGDIGGTNARFAWQEAPGSEPGDVAVYPGAQHETLYAAMQQYLQDKSKPTPAACAIGIANPIVGDQVKMTNHHWSFSIAALQKQLGVSHLVVINDFTALALALPALPKADLHQVGPGAAQPGGNIALIGAGTGLGVAGLVVSHAGQLVPVTGEGGHATLSAHDDHEAAVIEQLRHRFGHVSAERVLSGPGLVNLYQTLCALAAQQAEPLDAAAVISRAREGRDVQCATALDLFFNFLGGAAGDLALTLGARGGVYIGGGIVPRLIPELERSSFRDRFESKGRFREYLRDIPTLVISTTVSPAFLGAARALDLAPG
jgi:glucokinase